MFFFRKAARLILGVLALLSFSTFLWAGWQVLQNPLMRPLAEEGTDRFAARLERAAARAATPDAIAARVGKLLGEEDRNWIALDALTALAEERQIALPPDLDEKLAMLREEDHGWLAWGQGCASCTLRTDSCSLNHAVICAAPVSFTPVGDVIDLTNAGIDWARGNEVDMFAAGLSVIGLGSTAATVATGGTSYTVKIGASALKLARKLGLVSPRLLRTLTDAARNGIRWEELAKLETLSDPARVVRPEVFRPFLSVASDLGRIGGHLSPSETLHVLRFVDGPADSSRIAAASERMGKRSIGAMELLGKSRFIRAGARWGDEAVAFVAGMFSMISALAFALLGGAKTLVLTLLRRTLRNTAR